MAALYRTDMERVLTEVLTLGLGWPTSDSVCVCGGGRGAGGGVLMKECSSMETQCLHEES